MKCFICCLFLISSLISYSQDTPPSKDKDRASDRALPAESAVTSTGQVTIKGKVVPYKVTAGTQPVWDKEGKVIASLFYTYYERTDVTDKGKRPLVISFNGGPGS